MLLVSQPLHADDLNGKIVTEIRITGLEHTKEYIVTRELASRVGEPYSESKRAMDVDRLDRLRVFASMNVEPVVVDGGVRLDIEVRETIPYLPTVSIQVNDENGVSAGPGVRSLNFLGRGVELGVSAQVGAATNVQFFISDPWVTGNHVSYEAQYFRRDRENVFDDFQEISNELSLRIGSFIGRSGRIGGQVALTSIASETPGITISPNDRDTLPAYGIFLGYDTRDVWSRPRLGWWNELDVTRTHVQGADTSFWKAHFDVRRFHTWGHRHTVLLTSLTTLQSGTLGTDIPLYSDFHIGGANTVRGWQLDSRSGKNQFLSTAEYRFLPMDPLPFAVSFFDAYVGLQLAAFVDYGHAWSEPSDFSANQFITGYGVGLRVLFPFVDEMRFDVAWGEPGEGPAFHFAVFPKVVMQRQRVR